MRLLLTLCCLCSHITPSYAQQKDRLSVADSMRVARYEDSAWASPLFSTRRQRWLDSALAITPTRGFYWQQKAMPLYKQKKYELGAPYLDSAVKYDKDGRYLEYRGFMRATFSRNYQLALKDFYQARARYGNAGVMDHPYNFWIGVCHLQLEQLDSAKHYFRWCIDRKRKNGGDKAAHYLHWFYLGVTHYSMGNYDSAIYSLDRSLDQYPKFSDAKYYKALALEQKGDKKKAYALLQQAQADLREGYTMNEDNVFYETYPYQLNKFYLDGAFKRLEAAQYANRYFTLPSGDTMKLYYFVMLTKGPRRSETNDTAVINKIQRGHLDNMDRLAKLGKLKVAGPFGDDGDWRGLFVMDCDTKKEVEELLATDPAIKAGRLAYEIRPWWTQQGTVIR